MLKGVAKHPVSGKTNVVKVDVKEKTATFADGEKIKLDPKNPVKIV